jgi:aspartate racemase
MGPEASALFYQMVTRCTRAKKDQEHIDLILYSHASTPDRSASLLSGAREELLKVLVDGGRLLQDAGAEALALPCNTAHVLYDDLCSELEIPILNMVMLASARARELSGAGARVAVLATDGTIAHGIYQQELRRQGLVPYLPSPASQTLLMRVIYGSIKAGRTVRTQQLMPLEEELAQTDCALALLACTELSLLAPKLMARGSYLDALSVLARATVECGGGVVRAQRAVSPRGFRSFKPTALVPASVPALSSLDDGGGQERAGASETDQHGSSGLDASANPQQAASASGADRPDLAGPDDLPDSAGTDADIQAGERR